MTAVKDRHKLTDKELKAMAAAAAGGKSPGREVFDRLIHRPIAVVCMIFLVIFILTAACADFIVPYEKAIVQVASEKLVKPFSPGHFLGTDNLGRDIFARIIHGTRTALWLGICAAGLSVIISSVLSCLCAMYGGWVDNLIMRVKDVVSCVPGMVISLAICAALGNGIPQLVFALVFQAVSHQISMLRAYALKICKMDYLESAVALGGKPMYRIVKHMFPNIASMIIITASSQVASSIMTGATLGFIGLGVKQPTPEWGMMLNEGLKFVMTDQFMIYIPGIVLCLTSLFINTFGDCLRDAFDPQLKGKA